MLIAQYVEYMQVARATAPITIYLGLSAQESFLFPEDLSLLLEADSVASSRGLVTSRSSLIQLACAPSLRSLERVQKS
jgi:hypothetical protein